MKKTVSVLLVLGMLFCVVSCGKADSSIEEDPNTIKITKENYSKYFKVTTFVTDPVDTISELDKIIYGTNVYVTDEKFLTKYNNFHTDICSKMFDCRVRVDPISQHFLYNDVVFTYKFSGTYHALTSSVVTNSSDYILNIPFEAEVVVNVDISGSGFEYYRYELDEHGSKGVYVWDEPMESSYGTHPICNIELVDVRGTITLVSAVSD